MEGIWAGTEQVLTENGEVRLPMPFDQAGLDCHIILVRWLSKTLL